MSDPTMAELLLRNRSGDLDAIPVTPEDNSTWLQRFASYIKSGGWQDPQPGQRGTFVPGQVGQDGKVSPAVPGIIQQPAESLQSLMTAPLSDLARMRDPDITRTLAEQSFDVASMLPAAGVAATKAAPKRMPERAMVAASNPDDLNTASILAALSAQERGSAPTLYTFGGEKARTADKAALALATQMEKSGAPREQIWQDTGWFKGVDGKWRFEIDDSKAYPVGADNPRTLGQALHHPDLYAAYPDMKELKFVDDLDGSYVSGGLFKKPKITADALDTSTQLHEGQHRIQDVEGFTDGSSPAAEAFRALYGDGLMAKPRLLVDMLRNGGSVKVGGQTAEDALRSYVRNAGEAESRLVEKRMGLSAEDRRSRPPWLDYDVPENRQIVRLASNADDPTTAAVLAAMQGLDQPMPPAKLPQQMMERGSIGDQRPDIQARELQWQMPRNRGGEVNAPAAPANANQASSVAQMTGDLDALEQMVGAGLPPQRQNLAPDTPGATPLNNWKTPRDAINASMPVLKDLASRYGASLMSSEGIAARMGNLAYPPPADTHRMINMVADGIRRADPPRTPYGFGYQITDRPTGVQWMSGADGDTLVVGTKATADDVEKALRSKVGPDGRWKDDGLFSNPDDPTTASILALLSQQEKPSAGRAGAPTGTGPATGRLAGAPEPTGQPSGHLASDPQGLAPAASQGQPAQGLRATIESDPYSAAYFPPAEKWAPWTLGEYGMSPDAAEGARQALRGAVENGIWPDDWYIHGRSNRGDLDTGHVIQATQDPMVALQYSGAESGSGGGSIWAMQPAETSVTKDFRGRTPDMERLFADALDDWRDDRLPFKDDIMNSTYGKVTKEFIKDELEGGFAPADIVNSAAAYDNGDWLQWLQDRYGVDFVKTPDGAVAFDPRTIRAIRLYANSDPTTASILALLSQQEPGQANQNGDAERDRMSIAKGLAGKDKWLWYLANGNTYTPYDHISPSRDLLSLYKEASYGMPLDPYLNGGVAMGDTIDKDGNVNTRPADKKSDQNYVKMMQYGLHNPITALGAADPSRMALRDGPAPSGLPGYVATGLYAPLHDVGWASVADDDLSYGAQTLNHEFTHRGYKLLRDAYPELRQSLSADLEHTLIMAQDEVNRKKGLGGPPLTPPGSAYRPPTDEDRAALEALIAKAQHEIHKKRPYGGPR